jgi:hypothetical protein
MIRRRRNWKRLLIGGALASGLLTILLYGFVFSNMLSWELAIPWAVMRENVLMVDWTFLFLASFAIAILLGTTISRLNSFKGLISGLFFGLFLILTCTLLGDKVYGSGYYMLCYLVWGWSLGFIIHKKRNLIIRQY